MRMSKAKCRARTDSHAAKPSRCRLRIQLNPTESSPPIFFLAKNQPDLQVNSTESNRIQVKSQGRGPNLAVRPVAPSQTESNQKNWGRPSEKTASTKMKYYQTNPFSIFQYRMLISGLRQFRTSSPCKNEPILSRVPIRRTAGLRPAAGSQPKRKGIANRVRILPFDVQSRLGGIRCSQPQPIPLNHSIKKFS
jgi:hypothetical protein